MALPEEAVEVWRPVQVERADSETWRVLGPVPEGEVWEFQPGDCVRLERRAFADGEVGLVAVAFSPAGA
jgi:hypothetical protein